MTALLQQMSLGVEQLVVQTRLSLVEVRSASRGLGSGVVWHSDGLVLTCAHVVGNGPVTVKLADGTEMPARTLARDDSMDVAALMVEAEGLMPIGLGDSRNLHPGQWVLAVGYPWGAKGAATAGIVIGSGTDLPVMLPSNREWIAVDLPLRPGHSGGPMVDAAGRLIGICTMMAGPQVGMAVPAHVVNGFLKRKLGSGGRSNSTLNTNRRCWWLLDRQEWSLTHGRGN